MRKDDLYFISIWSYSLSSKWSELTLIYEDVGAGVFHNFWQFSTRVDGNISKMSI